MIEYVNGLLMDHDGWLVLIEKQRPAWQKDKLNGIGGKVEPGETPLEAMRREFREETGLDVTDWKQTVTLDGEDWKCYFFASFTKEIDPDSVKTTTDEPVHLINTSQIPDLWRDGTLISNVWWILQLSFDASVKHPVIVPMARHTV